jgi:CBS domain-containing protein
MASVITPKIACAKDFMTTRLTTLSPEMDVFEAIDVLQKKKISGAPVVDPDGNLLGVFSEASAMKVLIDAAYEGLPTNQVHAFMDWDPVTITPEAQLFSIIQSMINNNRRRLPVLDGTRLVGQISRRDIMREASKTLNKKGDRESTLLYLSALREMQDTPTRVRDSI